MLTQIEGPRRRDDDIRSPTLFKSSLATMSDDSDVVLNVYELAPPQDAATPPPPPGASASSSNSPAQSLFAIASMFHRTVLTPMGYGTYHTSVTVDKWCYTFGPQGITKSSASSREARDQYLPEGCTFHSTIILGTLKPQGKFAAGECGPMEVISKMRTGLFKPGDYHLINRNCNHFSEVLANAILPGEGGTGGLQSYPLWVNRLAKSSSLIANKGGTVCDVQAEARLLLGGGGSASSISSAPSKEKKVLTEKQQALMKKMAPKKKEIQKKAPVV
jgi:hypothetical protein